MSSEDKLRQCLNPGSVLIKADADLGEGHRAVIETVDPDVRAGCGAGQPAVGVAVEVDVASVHAGPDPMGPYQSMREPTLS